MKNIGGYSSDIGPSKEFRNIKVVEYIRNNRFDCSDKHEKIHISDSTILKRPTPNEENNFQRYEIKNF